VLDYTSKIGSKMSTETHASGLLALDGGFVDRLNYVVSRIPDSAKEHLLVSGCAAGSEMIVARDFDFQEIDGTEVVSELVDICRIRLKDNDGFSASFISRVTHCYLLIDEMLGFASLTTNLQAIKCQLLW